MDSTQKKYLLIGGGIFLFIVIIVIIIIIIIYTHKSSSISVNVEHEEEGLHIMQNNQQNNQITNNTINNNNTSIPANNSNNNSTINNNGVSASTSNTASELNKQNTSHDSESYFSEYKEEEGHNIIRPFSATTNTPTNTSTNTPTNTSTNTSTNTPTNTSTNTPTNNANTNTTIETEKQANLATISVDGKQIYTTKNGTRYVISRNPTCQAGTQNNDFIVNGIAMPTDDAIDKCKVNTNMERMGSCIGVQKYGTPTVWAGCLSLDKHDGGIDSYLLVDDSGNYVVGTYKG